MKNCSRQLRVGMQTKAIVVLALIVACVAVVGGGFHLSNAEFWLRDSDQRHALSMANAFAASARSDLVRRRNGALQHLVDDFIRNDTVHFVAVLDAHGRVVASASIESDAGKWKQLVEMPVAVSSTSQADQDLLTLARPIVLDGGEGDKLAGAIRLALDTSATTASLQRVQQRIGVVAAAMMFCAIPLGYLMVWRLLVQPIRRLVWTTRRLGQGDFSARSGIHRNDEVGELATAFDGMADEVGLMREELVTANEQLEQKVAHRTSELKLTNSRLRDEMAEKEDFVRAVSHDLNAPLRNIAGMATMVMMKWKDELPEEALARLQRIQANVDVETSLISELLELSRVKSSPQKREMVEMAALIGELAETFEFELNSRCISLDIKEPMPTLYIEPSRVRQVFQNLIDNAIKYMDKPAGGSIEVGYRFVDGGHQFYVTDNGAGIPPEDQKKIFYIFRRSTNVASSSVQGKGVGLAMVKTVVSNYDGRAWVRSALGKGAAFYVTFAARRTAPPAGHQEHQLCKDNGQTRTTDDG